MESSRRDLLNIMAEIRCILKNNPSTYYPVLVSRPKQKYTQKNEIAASTKQFVNIERAN